MCSSSSSPAPPGKAMRWMPASSSCPVTRTVAGLSWSIVRSVFEAMSRSVLSCGRLGLPTGARPETGPRAPVGLLTLGPCNQRELRASASAGGRAHDAASLLTLVGGQALTSPRLARGLADPAHVRVASRRVAGAREAGLLARLGPRRLRRRRGADEPLDLRPARRRDDRPAGLISG